MTTAMSRQNQFVADFYYQGTLFPVGVTEPWHRLPREDVVESPSVEIFKAIWVQSWATCCWSPCVSLQRSLPTSTSL